MAEQQQANKAWGAAAPASAALASIGAGWRRELPAPVRGLQPLLPTWVALGPTISEGATESRLSGEEKLSLGTTAEQALPAPSYFKSAGLAP